MVKEDKNSLKEYLVYPWRLLVYYKYEILAGLFLGGILSIGYLFIRKYNFIYSNPKRLKDLIMSFGNKGIFILIGFQVLQVIVFFIPGEFVQIAGGYIYGIFLGTIISLIGITIGSGIDFLLAKLLGRPFVERIMSRQHLTNLTKMLTLGKGENEEKRKRLLLIIFFVYLIPGFPKDVVAYIAGITEIRFKNFLLMSTLGRIPGILISAYFGAGIYKGNKVVLILIASLVCIIFIFGSLKGEKFIKRLRQQR